MKTFITSAYCLLFPIIFFSSPAFCQVKWSGLDYGASLGSMVYLGDLTPSALGYTKCLKPMLALNISKPVTPYFSLRGNVAFGSILADESNYAIPSWRQQRNFKFSSRVTELAMHWVYNFQGENDEYNFHRFQTYIFGGVGVSFVKIIRDYSGLNRNYFDQKSTVITGLSQDSVHKLPGTIPSVPIGAGIKYIINSKLALNTEITYRLMATDYLDGFKYAANKNKNDAYYGITMGIIYSPATNKYRCPTMKN